MNQQPQHQQPPQPPLLPQHPQPQPQQQSQQQPQGPTPSPAQTLYIDIFRVFVCASFAVSISLYVPISRLLCSVPSTCPHLNQYYDLEVFQHQRALQQHQQQQQSSNHAISSPPPSLPPLLADIAALFRYLATISASHRRHRCQHCHRYSGRLHACAMCTFIGCFSSQHIHQHSATSQQQLGSIHWCAVDIERGSIYCFYCKDYVYHQTLSQIQENAKMEELIRRKKREETSLLSLITPSDRDLFLGGSRLVGSSTNGPDADALMGLRGIYNLGSTCFMSVILQACVHNPLLRNYFLSDLHNQQRCSRKRSIIAAHQQNGNNNNNGMNSICFACDLDQVFASFYSGDHSPYAPSRLLLSMWHHADHLSGQQQQDAHEFYMALLDGIHDHCQHQQQQSDNMEDDQQHHQQETAPHRCNCVVHTIYGGQLRSDVQCRECLSVSTAIDPIFDISVDISQLSQQQNIKKNQNIPPVPTTSPNTNNPASSTTPAASAMNTATLTTTTTTPSNQTITLLDALNRFTQLEHLYAYDQFFCRSCQRYTEATKQLSFHTLPLVLSIHIKRFERRLSKKPGNTNPQQNMMNNTTLNNTNIKPSPSPQEQQQQQQMDITMNNHSSQTDGNTNYNNNKPSPPQQPAAATNAGPISNKLDTYISFPLTILDLSPYLHATLPTPLSPSIKPLDPMNPSAHPHHRSAAAGTSSISTTTAISGIACSYVLFAVIVHRGNIETGHYIVYFKKGEYWYKNDDRVIVKVTEQEVQLCQAYLLFYIRQHFI